ncbi:MAG: PepSY domain-containing protein [Phycisphaerales bacterium]
MARRPVRKAFNVWSRKLHRWGAIGVAIPVLIVIGSGLVLQLKKDVAWVQPPTQRGEGGDPSLTFDEIIAIAVGVEEAGWTGWDDIDRLDVRPGRGVVKVRGNNRWEVQIDTATGAVLASTYRRSDLIEQIHDGSWFHEHAKLWVFLPSGVILFGLWITGMYLWILPISAKRAGRRRRAAAQGGAA